MKPKEILLRDGKITSITRGRISRENHEYLASLADKGERIDGYEVKVSSKATGEKTYSNAKPPVGNEKVIADFTYRFPLDTKAHAFWNGNKMNVSMREACWNCGVSLVQCICGVPEVVVPDGTGSMRVYIEGDI